MGRLRDRALAYAKLPAGSASYITVSFPSGGSPDDDEDEDEDEDEDDDEEEEEAGFVAGFVEGFSVEVTVYTNAISTVPSCSVQPSSFRNTRQCNAFEVCTAL